MSKSAAGSCVVDGMSENGLLWMLCGWDVSRVLRAGSIVFGKARKVVMGVRAFRLAFLQCGGGVSCVER